MGGRQAVSNLDSRRAAFSFESVVTHARSHPRIQFVTTATSLDDITVGLRRVYSRVTPSTLTATHDLSVLRLRSRD